MSDPQQGYYDQQAYDRPSHDPSQPMSRPTVPAEDKARKMNYAQELQDQIRMKQEQKYNNLRNEREKEVQALRSRLDNDPFGKQGSGAPLRDIFGNIITNKTKALHQLHDFPGNNSNRAAAEPVYSLKARLARENIVTQSLDGLPRGFSQNLTTQSDYNQPNPYAFQQQSLDQGQFPGQNGFPFQYPFPYPMMMMPGGFPQGGFPQGGFPQMPMMGYPGANGNVGSMQDVGSMPDGNRQGNQRGGASRELDGYGARGGGRGFVLPQGDDNSHEAKKKKQYTYQMYQDELVQQMEEKKKKKLAEEQRKKMEDEMEEERVRRENAEMREQDQNEAQKRKKHFIDFQQENAKIMSTVQSIQNSGVLVMEPKKNKGKRPRTPVEEVTGQQVQVNVDLGGIENVSEVAFPNEVGKRIQTTIENQLADVKRDWDNQQMELHGQLLMMKKQLLDANKDRTIAQAEIGELKNHLRSQQISEEIRRTELYNALLKGQAVMQQPPLLPTITRFEEERDADTRPFEFPRGNRNLYRRNKEDEDALDAMLAGQSKIIDANAKVGTHGRLVERVTSRPGTSDMGTTDFGVNYLNYFNPSNDHAGIKVENKYGFDLPDDLEMSGKTDLYYDTKDGVGEILRKNKERLDLLEDIEYKEFGGDKQYAKRTPGTIDDEIYQMLKSDSVEDDLLYQINNPRRCVGEL